MTALNQMPGFQTEEKTKIHIDDPLAVSIFSHNLNHRLRELQAGPETEIILLCIGTDRSTGDCLGPLVGSKMAALNQNMFTIYGTLDQPVHAANLNEVIKEINQDHPDAMIMAIDACLGHLESVGYINIGNGSLQPGAGVNKDLPRIGSIYVTGIVNVGGFMEYLVLQNTRLNLVMRMADVMVQGLRQTILIYQQ